MIAGNAVLPGHSGDTISIRAQFLHEWQDQAQACASSGFIAMTDETTITQIPAATTGRWRQADVKRAINAAEQAGLQHYRVEIAPDGTLSIVVGAASPEGSEVVAARG